MEALIRLLSRVTTLLNPKTIVIKSEALCILAGVQIGIQPKSWWLDLCAKERENIERRSSSTYWKSVDTCGSPANGAIFKRYPLKYPTRVDINNIEICRFHNYSAVGCLRGRENPIRCLLNHFNCHWFGEGGHVAGNLQRKMSGAMIFS